MFYSIINYIDEMDIKYPNSLAYCDLNKKLTFHQLKENAICVSLFLERITAPQKPVIVFMDKGVDAINAMLGVLYFGCYYVPIDQKMPKERIQLIMDQLSAHVVVVDKKTIDDANSLFPDYQIVEYEETIGSQYMRRNLSFMPVCSVDIAYVLFTSGSTGTPKGVTISHGALIDFIEWICEKYAIGSEIRLCNQAPFYFDASVPDLFIPLKTGGCCYIPPQSYYLFPAKIMDFIDQYGINTLIWVPSALINVIKTRALDVHKPPSIKHLIFCGEVLPVKYLFAWREYYPNIRYTNMYGPTEATYACSYYDIPDDFDELEIPIGQACSNCRLILLDDNNNEISSENTIGEICVQGMCLSNGYYGIDNEDNKAFVQNPNNDNYRDIFYKTGDLAIFSKGTLYYKGRRDGQIKKNGYRIELGEIESIVMIIQGIEECCCFFEDNRIWLVYCGGEKESKIKEILIQKMPKYMIPDEMIRRDKMPHNLNGKIDRIFLKKYCLEGKE